ncbi:Piezo-type mechanosensitive ion channel component 2 [Saguinus oedipus]|uniref:Piezo-type mechanosensitive ion channel component 2 n=1 Tax=Saguinus oedipus TaxID=9490 RepID=A0ABQ9UD66_SAGOE|nr:Piezo-type mechanosensitive ion channel component 2 [Saguinus oedipus]
MGSVPTLSPDSEPTQCTMLYSRQGTTETIEEVEAEQEEEARSTVPESGEAKEYEAAGYDVGAVGAEEVSLTPEEELTQFSTLDGDVEAPPSYSKAVSFEHLSFGSQDDSTGKNHMAVSPDDSRTDKLGSSILPPLTHELTASELLLNK